MLQEYKRPWFDVLGGYEILRDGARVDVEAEGNRILISPARPHYVLADLLKEMTPEAMREAFDWGLVSRRWE